MNADIIVEKLVTALQSDKLNEHYNKIIVQPLKEEIKELRSEIDNLKETMKAKDEEIKELQVKVDTMETDLSMEIDEMENKILTQSNALMNNKIEQIPKNKNLIIEGIPETKDELNKSIIGTLNKCLKVSLNEEDIEKTTRIGKTKDNKPKKF